MFEALRALQPTHAPPRTLMFSVGCWTAIQAANPFLSDYSGGMSKGIFSNMILYRTYPKVGIES